MFLIGCSVFLLYLLTLLISDIAFANDEEHITASHVSLGANGEMRVNNQPFLPIFVWLQPVRNFDFLMSLGINTFMGEGAERITAKEFLDEAQSREAWGIIHAQEKNWQLKNHPALLCWMFSDEPDLPATGIDGQRLNTPRTMPETIAAQYEALKAVDKNHPVYLNLTASFYKQFARYDDELYRRYCQATDIVGYDLYPVTGWGKPEWVPLIGKATRKLVDLSSPDVPVWAILECTTKLRWVSQEKLNRLERPQGARDFELRSMVWQAIVNGAKGIGYFPHRWEPYKQVDISEELQAEMKSTNRKLTELTPVILSPDALEPVEYEVIDGESVDVMTKECEGKLYLFTVNNGFNSVRIRFVLPSGMKANEVQIYDEQEKIVIQGGIFEDNLEKLGVRIYVIHPNSSH